jgi:Protein of unknown function (DUF1592)/Protein of unknown function (DUF1588)/Protein of unknown function (DUF1595)/Protein of unknown function (DUF1587)/Protein of unknown function (DUF1585)
MTEKMGRSRLCQNIAMVMLALTAGCTGVSSLPSGGNATGTPGTGTPGTGTPGTGTPGTGTPGTGTPGTGTPGTGTPGTGTPGTGTPGTGTPGTGTPGAGLPGAWDKITATTTLDPGRVVLRRLNNAEYDNTVRDLLGTTTKPSQTLMFAADNVNLEGFDTVGTVLSYSSLLMEGQDSASDSLLTELLARPKTDPLRMRIMLCEPTAATLATCAPQILKPFMTNAYRRPALDAEVADLVALATSISTSSTDPIKGLTGALKAVLMSPHFLFHVEAGGTATTSTKLNDYEVANRLSYFLWSTMPDAQLMAAASTAKLAPAGADYTSQIARLIADPIKFQAFVDNYGGQALTLRDVKNVAPQADLFKTFDDSLRLSIASETSAFFASMIKDAQPLTALLLADFSFVNDRLAKHYGIAGIPAGQTTFTKVPLPATSNRMGLLTQETFLTVTSMPDRTSPVKRGNWILDQLLCDSTPPPPPSVPQFVTPTVASGLTVRAALEAHRASPACAICHNTMDPLGLAFENYDAIGAYRTMDNGKAVDTSGVLTDGRAFGGAKELATLLANDSRFTRCMVKQALTYAVGRSFETPEGRGYVAGLADPLVKANATWPDLLRTVATSEAFLTRRGEGP